MRPNDQLALLNVDTLAAKCLHLPQAAVLMLRVRFASPSVSRLCLRDVGESEAFMALAQEETFLSEDEGCIAN